MRKKILWIVVLISIGSFVLNGCGRRVCGDALEASGNTTELALKDVFGTVPETEISQENIVGVQTLEVNELGLTLHAKDVTSESVTIVCTQSGGSPTGELNTGSYYVLEQEVQGVWRIAEYAPDLREENVAWTAEAWIIPMNDTVEWKVDWEWLYGSLEPGHYRIGKEVMDFRGSGDYDKEMYYAEFEIKE